MKKTTVYLPDDVKAALTRAAGQRGQSEAEIIRLAVVKEVGTSRPRPRGGLWSSTELIARNADDYLTGFGEH